LCFDEKVSILICYSFYLEEIINFLHFIAHKKICETLRKEKELLGMISNIKNTSPSEELQRRSAGILFTMNDLLKKSKIYF